MDNPKKTRCWQKCFLDLGFCFKYSELPEMVVSDVVVPLFCVIQNTVSTLHFLTLGSVTVCALDTSIFLGKVFHNVTHCVEVFLTYSLNSLPVSSCQMITSSLLDDVSSIQELPTLRNKSSADNIKMEKLKFPLFRNSCRKNANETI